MINHICKHFYSFQAWSSLVQLADELSKISFLQNILALAGMLHEQLFEGFNQAMTNPVPE